MEASMIGIVVVYFLVCPALVQNGVSEGTSQPGLSWEGSEFLLFDLAVDYTPLRYPLLSWSEQFELRERFRQFSYMRRCKRYFASLPNDQLPTKSDGFSCLIGPMPFEWPEERQFHRPSRAFDQEYPKTWDALKNHREVELGKN
jgi:hypothetical protein